MAPGDGERIYNHAQSVFWLGYLDWQLGSYSEASSAFVEYLVMANRLVELDPDRIEWLGELAYAYTNVGVYALDTQDIEQAKSHFKQAERLFSRVIAREPDSLHWPMQRAQALAWLADSMMYDEPLAVIIDYRKQEIAIYRYLLEQDPGNAQVIGLLVNSLYADADLALDQDQAEDAQVIAGEAQGLGRTLVELDPDNTYSLFLLAKIQEQLARIYSNLDERNHTSTLLADAASILHHLLKNDSEVIEWVQLEKQILFDAALSAIGSGAPVPELRELSKAVVELGKMKAGAPNRRLITLIANGHIALAYGHAHIGEAQTAREHFLLAAGELESIPGRGLPESRALLAECYRAVGRTDQAQVITQELAQLGFVRPPFFTRHLKLGTAFKTGTD
jgi:tetratricopeptide (TPR) repeat protein